MNCFPRATLAVLLLFVTACTGVPSRVRLDKTAVSSRVLHKVALLGVPASNRITLERKISGGVVIQLAEATTTEKNSEAFLQKMRERKVEFESRMAEMVQSTLRQDGYEVSYFPQEAPTVGSDGNADYSRIHLDADAIMSVWFGSVGYVKSIGMILSEDYRPTVGVSVRLVDGRTKRVLYQQAFLVSAHAAGVSEIEYVRPNPKYHYDSAERVLDHFDEAVEGITDGEREVALRIAQQLR